MKSSYEWLAKAEATRLHLDWTVKWSKAFQLVHVSGVSCGQTDE